MADGKELDKGKTTEALKAKALGLAAFEKKETLIPESAYVLAVTGTG